MSHLKNLLLFGFVLIFTLFLVFVLKLLLTKFSYIRYIIENKDDISSFKMVFYFRCALNYQENAMIQFLRVVSVENNNTKIEEMQYLDYSLTYVIFYNHTSFFLRYHENIMVLIDKNLIN